MMSKQSELPPDTMIQHNGNGTAFKDPAFMENKAAPIHRWVPWIAGFSATFIDSVLATYLNHRKTATVLDPFAGVGTTLLQSAIRGHNVTGFEINPYAALAMKAKLNTIHVKTNKLNKAIDSIRLDARSWQNGRFPTAIAPETFRSHIPFYSPRVEKQVLHAITFISEIDDEHVRNLFRVAFGAVMVSFSNYTYEPSLSTRPGAGKPLIEDADVAATLIEKLVNMRDDIEWLRSKINKDDIGNVNIHNEDFFAGEHRLESRSVHLMVTSPPYLNNYHYVRNTRPQLYWLSLIASPHGHKLLEENNFGTFWQIARGKKQISLEFHHHDLERILAKLRKINIEKGQYGGSGWANYATSYFNDCNRFIIAIKRILARSGTGVVVVGNSILQGINIPVQDIIGDIAKDHGLSIEGIYLLRNKRVGNSITTSAVRSSNNKTTLDESAVVFRKR